MSSGRGRNCRNRPLRNSATMPRLRRPFATDSTTRPVVRSSQDNAASGAARIRCETGRRRGGSVLMQPYSITSRCRRPGSSECYLNSGGATPNNKGPMALPRQPRTFLPLASNQREIWFDQMLDPGLPQYNIGGYVEFRSAIDLAALRRAYEILVERHDALRRRG